MIQVARHKPLPSVENGFKVIDQSFRTKEINIKLIVIKGHYPKEGWLVCRGFQMYVTVQSGQVNYVCEKERKDNLVRNDDLLVEADTPHYFVAHQMTTLHVLSTAIWTPENYKNVLTLEHAIA